MTGLVAASIEKKTITWFLAFLILVSGIISFGQLGRLEDPDFTVKVGLIVTQYPGASPAEVELEVTDRIETKLQEMPQLKELYSFSKAGVSIIKVTMRDQFWADQLPQIWDEMRKKVRDVSANLPPGAGKPQVVDDFSFVYGFVLAVTSDGYSYGELEAHTKRLRKELGLVPGVARTLLWGVQPRVVYLDVSTAQLAQLGITGETFLATLRTQNQVVDAGAVEMPGARLRVDVTGAFESPEQIGDLRIRQSLQDSVVNPVLSRSDSPPLRQRTTELIAIKDLATVRPGFLEPPPALMRFNGQPALAIALANVSGGNIIDTGKAIDKRLEELKAELPAGIGVEKLAWQSELVDESIDGFMINLVEAVVIVLIVVALAMGWRMGIIIGTGLILTILATFIVMAVMGIELHRVSLGALVIALGMMVDNSIVVADGMAVRLARRMDPKQAAIEAASRPAMPLLGATLIAVMAFYPVFAATDGTGEYARTLFLVVGISLVVSWVLSATVTPLQCLGMLRPPKEGAQDKDPYGGGFFRVFRGFLEWAIRRRALTVATMVVLLAASLWGFLSVEQQFFPDSTRRQFMVDYWAPEGTPIQTVSAKLRLLEAKIQDDERVKNYGAFVGAGGPRFYLPVDPELPFASFGQVIINTETLEGVDSVIADLKPWLAETYPEVLVRLRKYSVGPGDTWPFEYRISGPGEADLDTLRALGDKGMAILRQSPLAKDVRTDMRQRVQKVVADYSQDRARWATVTRADVAETTKRSFDGLPVGLYREGDTLLPIILRNIDAERQTAASTLGVMQVRPLFSLESVPLAQVTEGVRVAWEEPIITRYNRRRQVAIQAAPDGVTFPTLRAGVIEQFENLELPDGFSVFWDGEYDSTITAQTGLIPGSIPTGVVIAIILVVLFNALRPPVIIALVIPFAAIGITWGLLATNIAFTFMALLGAMSLVGMMIKNGIVLLDEINENQAQGIEPYLSVVQAAVSRLRPVVLAALTTVLGVMPLLQDAFWISMAATIMAGLTFGTLLTMILIPVLYTILFRIPSPRRAS